MLESNLNFIWKYAIKFHSNHIRGKGGITILVNLKWGSIISSNGVSPCQRAIWFTVNINNKPIGFYSIYEPNDTKEESLFGISYQLSLIFPCFLVVASTWLSPKMIKLVVTPSGGRIMKICIGLISLTQKTCLILLLTIKILILEFGTLGATFNKVNIGSILD